MSNYKEGTNQKYALIFSCPGLKELKFNRPCAGVTGKNLEILFLCIRNSNKHEIPTKRSEYRINNAWPIVEYKRKKTEKTEAEDREMMQEWNLLRLKEELSGVEKVIVFGSKAKKVVNEINKKYQLGIKIVECMHLSMHSINKNIKVDVNGKQIIKGNKNNTVRRIGVLANRIEEQW